MTLSGEQTQQEKVTWRKAFHLLDDNELRTLVFDLGIHYDALKGDEINGRLLSLLDYLAKDGRLPELQDYIFTEQTFNFVKEAYLAEKLDLKRRDISGADTAESPYRGLEAFHEEHTHLYFGRAPLVSELIQTLEFTLSQRDQPNFLAIIGASGSGKSSLVLAGMLPKIRQKGWPIFVMTPTADPLKSMARALMSHAHRKKAVLHMQDDLAENERSLDSYIPDILAAHQGAKDHLILVIDQFEELFTLCDDPTQRDHFIDNLLFALNAKPHSQLVVLLTLRADFYHRVAWSDGLRHILQNQQKYIGRMARADLQQTIAGPAHLYGYRLQEGLVKRILDDVGNEPGNLPLLSHALQKTWEHREGEDNKELTLAGYEKAGGVKGAIARTADAKLAQLNDSAQAITRNIFTRLTELGEGAEDTRRRARLSELIPNNSDSEAVLAVLAQLADARLITTDRHTVDVSHEALIREWHTLRQWLDADRDGLRLLEQLNKAATFWDEQERQDRDLYSGTRLDKALEWEADSAPQLSQLETSFLRASQQAKEKRIQEEQERVAREIAQAKALAAEAEKRQQAEIIAREQAQMRAEEAERSSAQLRQRRNIAFGLAGIALILAVIAFALFGRAQESAQIAAENEQQAVWAQATSDVNAANAATKEAEALTNANLAATSQAEAERNEAQAFAEATKAIEAQQTAVENEEIADRQRTISDAQSMLALSSVLIENGSSPSITETEKSLLMGVQAIRLNEALSADIVHNLSDTQLRNMLDRNYRPSWQTILQGHSDWVLSVAFAPDGQTLASASSDQTIRLWDLNNPDANPTILQGHSDWVHSVAFAPDGQTLASASDDQTIRLWDLNNPDANPTILQGHSDWVRSVTFAPDGQTLASASDDQTIRLWPTLEGLITIACDKAGRNMTWEEWQTYLPTVPYERTCDQYPPHPSVPEAERPVNG